MSEDFIVEELKTLFVEEYIVGNRINFIDCDPLTWFDQELKTVFDIDVFQYDFSSKKGYHIYEKNNISVLLLRMKNLNNRFEEAFKEFLGKDLTIKSIQNKGDQKEYSGVYSKFKRTIKIPDWYLDQMYESHYVRHFYTDKEIATFRKRWA
ncbi:putative capsular polysaccharide synthesis family protein [Fodinibius sp. SL11]|uniref:putative capsular polysaccharide synthesis family protein n=1 Tax=Fodinibius sp. SL11 TaxID=3425690 RepID=UPI003F883D2C